MEYRSMGRSGLKVSVVGLGTNAFGGRASRETAIRIVHEALDTGITLIDTANLYTGGASETIIGEALAHRRPQAVLATKAGLRMGSGPYDYGASRLHLMRELDASLKRLRTDYIDLYQVHTFDPATPLDETLRTLDDMVRSGRVRYIGASNYHAWELAKANGIAERLNLVRFVSIQPSYSLADRTPENELVKMAVDAGVGMIAYFPLAGGILTGKYRAGEAWPVGSRADKDPQFVQRLDQARLALADGLSSLSGQMGCTPAQLALAWLIQRPGVVSAIAGATSPEQVGENLGAVSLEIPADVQSRLDQLSQPFIFGPPFAEYRL